MSSPFSIFICDLDRYKKINDNYGHKAGDAVLKNVASILSYLKVLLVEAFGTVIMAIPSETLQRRTL